MHDNAKAERATGNAARDAAFVERARRAAGVFSAALLLFLTTLVVAAMLAALGLLADGLVGPVLTVFWWFIGISAFVQTIATLFRAGTPPSDRKPACTNGPDFPGATRVLRYLTRVAPIALVVGGYYELAALLVYVICLGIAGRAEDRRILGELERVDPVSRGIRALVFASAELLVPVVRPVGRLLVWRGNGDTPFIAVVLSLPFWLVYLLLLIPCKLVYWLFRIPFKLAKAAIDRLRTRRGDRAVVEQLRSAGTLVYFVYSEPHQRDHFLGENGVLKPLAHRVLMRDWRVDLEPLRRALQNRPVAGADVMFLRRFGLRRLKDDLPFVAVLAEGGKIHPFHCSGPYRQRRRDGGVALIRIEDDIREVLEKHVAALGAVG